MPQQGEPYDFLNDYIDKIISRSSSVDDQPMEDDNDFFSSSDDESDNQDENDGISYSLLNDDDFGFHQANAELRQDGDPIDDEGNPLPDQPQPDFGPGGMTPDEESDSFYGTGSTGSFYDEMPKGDASYITSLEGDSELPGLANKISAKESQGKYTAYNPAGGGTGAVGKYQFRWNIWKDSIQKVTGVKTQKQFLHSPKAQEKYFSWYKKNYLLPESKKLQAYNKAGLSADQLAELVHFRGTAGAKQYLQGKVPDKPESYNSSISDYIGFPGYKQAGGAVVAATPSAQYHGLNNGSFNQMVFPMEGENTFRGLDDGTPVYLEDETGKKKILKGRKHKTKMKGRVFETRLNK